MLIIDRTIEQKLFVLTIDKDDLKSSNRLLLT